MSHQIHTMAQQLFGADSIEVCTEPQIRELTEEYPFFGPAHFLFLEKLKNDNSPEYILQYQKSVLYYHDPLSFEDFISSGRFYTALDFDAENIPLPEQELMVSANSEKIISTEQEIEAPVQELVFEPYHTVDYFASQGIKLSQEENPKDKFGRQLKSFTEWLKTMKRIPPVTDSNNIHTVAERKVENLAQDSVHESEVYTESMAEVWKKQGNLAKALEVYNKLSLLNPSKRAYFAAKIENLKRS